MLQNKCCLFHFMEGLQWQSHGCQSDGIADLGPQRQLLTDSGRCYLAGLFIDLMHHGDAIQEDH